MANIVGKKVIRYHANYNGIHLLAVDGDPSLGAGVTAPLGSLAGETVTGSIYSKTGGGSTAWTQLGGGGGSSIWDTDLDTGIDCEANPDEDIIRFYAASAVSEVARLNAFDWFTVGIDWNLYKSDGSDLLFTLAANVNTTAWTIGVDDSANADFYISRSSDLTVPIVFIGGSVGAYTDRVGISTVTPAAPLSVRGRTVVDNDGAAGERFLDVNPSTYHLLLGDMDGLATGGWIDCDHSGGSPFAMFEEGMELRFRERGATNTDYAGFRAAVDVTTSTVWDLPPADGANLQCLATNGAGVLDWLTVATTGIWDTDFDTGIDCEATPDNDQLRFYCGAPKGQLAQMETVNLVKDGPNGMHISQIGDISASSTSQDYGLEITGSNSGSFENVGLTVGMRITQELGLPTQLGNTTILLDCSGTYASMTCVRRSGLTIASSGFSGDYNPIAFQCEALDIVDIGYDNALSEGFLALKEYGGGAGQRTQLRFYEQGATPPSGGNHTALVAADSIAANVVFTLPSADGVSGDVLQTDGAGNLSFVGAPSPSTVVVSYPNAYEGLLAGDALVLVYDGVDGRMEVAKAAADNNEGEFIGFAQSAAAIGTSVSVILVGDCTVVPAEVWVAADTGKKVYLDTTDGQVTTDPSGLVSGEFETRVGFVTGVSTVAIKSFEPKDVL